MLRRAWPCVAPRSDSLSPSFGSVREACRAGHSPKKTAVRRERLSETTNTTPSIRISCNRGSAVGEISSNRRLPKKPSASPEAPPKTASNRLSDSICSTRRLRAAPRADRIAISLCLPDVRASTRLATLAQAISRTNPTATSKTKSGVRTSPTISLRYGTTLAPICCPLTITAYSGGYNFSTSAMTRPASSWAWAGVTPRLSRPTTVWLYSTPHSCSSAGVKASGTHNSAGPRFQRSPRKGKSKPFGITPITVYGSRSSRIVRPRIFGSAPYRRCQSP